MVSRSVAVLVLGVALAPSAASAAAVCDSNLMIVLDRSCSMDAPPSAGVAETKWELSVLAIGQLTTQYAGQLNFGLIMFPDQTGTSCLQDGPIYVNVGPGTETAVNAALAGTQPTGPCVTNIDRAMEQVATDPSFGPVVDPSGRRGFALLISDGKQSGSCGGTARDPVTLMHIEALYAAGYPTYVVGFGGGVDPASLNTFAMAGGVPRAGDPLYYQADNAAELEMALDAIAGSIIDDEFGNCAGTPCPDGRCFGFGEVCTGGVCVGPAAPDAGPPGPTADGAPAPGGDGGGPGGDGDASGCGCRTGGASTGAGGVAFFLLLAGALLARRRRP